MDKLGALKYLKLSEIWPHEERDFTPWLAQEENLKALSEELGLELQLDRVEVPVGPYWADILAKDVSGEYVVIENQFNKTNHDHLGKLLTYGATLGASIVVWVAEQFSDEHRKAIQWLNDRTTEELSLYAVQPEVLQIDGSRPAVRFYVIERPNEIVKAAKDARSSGDLSESQQLQMEFWSLFQKRLLERKVVTSAQSPRPQYWFAVALGRSNIHISNTLNTAEGKLSIRVYLNNQIADAALEQLFAQKDGIEAEIGSKLQWNPYPEKKDKIIVLTRDVDLQNRTVWAEYVEWLVDETAKFRHAFMPRVRALKLKTASEIGLEES